MDRRDPTWKLAMMPWAKAEHAPAQRIECPLCGSEPGERCLNTSGYMRQPHGKRRRAAIKLALSARAA